MLRRTMLIAGTAFLLLSFALASQDKGRGKGQDEARVRATVEVFLDADRNTIHDYFGMQPAGLPSGWAKRDGDLPPGLERQLRKKGHLPPGLEKKLVPFPVELTRKLPPLAPGLERGSLGGHAVIINPSTRLILDVFIPLP